MIVICCERLANWRTGQTDHHQALNVERNVKQRTETETETFVIMHPARKKNSKQQLKLLAKMRQMRLMADGGELANTMLPTTESRPESMCVFQWQ